METKTEKKFYYWSFEMAKVNRWFDRMIVGTISSLLLTIILLLVDFFQIPYILTGILPYVIKLGLVAIPFFFAGIFVMYHRREKIKIGYVRAKSELIGEISALAGVEKIAQ
jgi:hydrogenase-4 membrane subunit HyfE